MYSVVLMMALSGGTDAVDFGHRCHGCHGCRGWCGGCYCSGWCGGSCGGWCGGYSGGCCGGYSGCCGGYVTGGCYGGCGGVIVTAGTSAAPTGSMAVARQSAPATIIVSLPAGARLSIDGNPVRSTSSRRMLVSPALQPGNAYVYTLRAEANGQVQSQDITVRAGQTTQAQFRFSTSGVASR